MKKTTKIILVLAILAALFALWRSGAFRIANVIASFDSPDEKYVLVFKQLGEPEWPFGQTDVRLELKDQNGKKLNSIDTFVANDGGNAYETNIKSLEWTDESVIIILRSSEMSDQTIELSFKK